MTLLSFESQAPFSRQCSLTSPREKAQQAMLSQMADHACVNTLGYFFSGFSRDWSGNEIYEVQLNACLFPFGEATAEHP